MYRTYIIESVTNVTSGLNRIFYIPESKATNKLQDKVNVKVKQNNQCLPHWLHQQPGPGHFSPRHFPTSRKTAEF
jgi:hypothetical protein